MTDKDDDPKLPNGEADHESDGGSQDTDEQADVPPSLHPLFEGLGKLYADLYSSALSNIAAGLTPLSMANWFPQIKTTDLLLSLPVMPTLGLDLSALSFGKGLAEVIQTPYFTALTPFVEFLEQQHKQWDSLFESFRKLAEEFFPPNWKGVTYPDFDTIEAILVDEGIPLAWEPRQEVLQALLDAPDVRERRRIIGRRWRGIVSDCEAALGEVSHPTLQCKHSPHVPRVILVARVGGRVMAIGRRVRADARGFR